MRCSTKPHRHVPFLVLGCLGACIGMSGCGDERQEPPSQIESGRVEASLEAAHVYLNSQELEKAEAILAVLIEKVPEEARARELLGQLLATRAAEWGRNGDTEAAAVAYGEAYAHYQIAAELTPDSAGLQHSAGMMAMAAGANEQGLAHFLAAGELDSRNPQYPLYAAQIQIQNGATEAARDSLRRVLTLDPDEPLAHASLAMMELEAERFDAALAHIAEARVIAPGDLRFRVQEAKIHRRARTTEVAVEILIGLSSWERADPAVAYELATSYTDLGKHEKAAAVWANQFRQRRDDADAYRAAVRAGECALRAGRRSEAIAWLEEAQIRAQGAIEVKVLEDALFPD